MLRSLTARRFKILACAQSNPSRPEARESFPDWQDADQSWRFRTCHQARLRGRAQKNCLRHAQLHRTWGPGQQKRTLLSSRYLVVRSHLLCYAYWATAFRDFGCQNYLQTDQKQLISVPWHSVNLPRGERFNKADSSARPIETSPNRSDPWSRILSSRKQDPSTITSEYVGLSALWVLPEAVYDGSSAQQDVDKEQEHGELARAQNIRQPNIDNG